MKLVVVLIASWYSIASLQAEGTYKHSKGVMANGAIFNESIFTAAGNQWPLGTVLLVTNTKTNKRVTVTITDHIATRFAKTRIDLSIAAFKEIADPKEGIVKVKVEEVGYEPKVAGSK